MEPTKSNQPNIKTETSYEVFLNKTSSPKKITSKFKPLCMALGLILLSHDGDAINYKRGNIVVDIDEMDVGGLSYHSPAEYNGLKDIEDASELQLSLNLKALFQEAQQLICAYNLHDDIGLRLLHKHNTLADHEKMVEYFSQTHRPENGGALVTTPFTKEEVYHEEAVKAAPSIWAVKSSDENPFVALEYTTDVAGITSYRKMIQNQEFLENIRTLLLNHKVESLMGFCLLNRSNLNPKPDEVLLEDTWKPTSENILYVSPSSEEYVEGSAVTSWHFSPQAWGNYKERDVITHGRCWTVCVPTPWGDHVKIKKHKK